MQQYNWNFFPEGMLHSSSLGRSLLIWAVACPEVPSPPSTVTLLERVRDYMVLGWQAPAKTGGADIRGYYLDYRTIKGNVKSKWHEINTKASTDTTYKVTSQASYVLLHLDKASSNRSSWYESTEYVKNDICCCIPLCLQVEDLKENKFYQFQVRAVNQAGISEGSVPNTAFECKEWTVAVPGKSVNWSSSTLL